MKKTTFAGLTVLSPGEGLDTDDSAFTSRDPITTDHFLRLGAKLHRHNGQSGLTNPLRTPSASVIASGGTIAPELSVSIGYTLEDSQGGETQLSPLATVTTGAPMSIPVAAPSAAFDSSAGSLTVNTYYYGVTFTDSEGGETPIGPTVSVERPPGYASGRVLLSNLTYGMAAAGATGWRLYRAIGGGSFSLLSTGGVGTSTFTDDGTVGANCDVHPPLDGENTTKHVNRLKVIIPTADANMASAAGINLYATVSGDFGGASLLDTYPIASAGASATYGTLEFQEQSPPDVNRSVGGASLIDPDTELLDWHWKRAVSASASLPVSSEVNDVRVAQNEAEPYIATASGWRRMRDHLTAREVQTGVEHTLQVTDDGRAIDVNEAVNTKILIPSDAVVGLPNGAVVQVMRAGSGSVGIAASAGVTLHSKAGASAISGQWGVVHLRKRGPNSWVLYGDIA